jgi:hypothetical protein
MQIRKAIVIYSAYSTSLAVLPDGAWRTTRTEPSLETRKGWARAFSSPHASETDTSVGDPCGRGLAASERTATQPVGIGRGCCSPVLLRHSNVHGVGSFETQPNHGRQAYPHEMISCQGHRGWDFAVPGYPAGKSKGGSRRARLLHGTRVSGVGCPVPFGTPSCAWDLHTTHSLPAPHASLSQNLYPLSATHVHHRLAEAWTTSA